MPYIIDGHNLIPKISGLTLKDIDDEIQLIELLQEFCRHERKRVEVYFDNAPSGSAQRRSYGMVMANFVRQGRTADEAISDRLNQLGKEARNWTVVSSDAAVRSASRYARAQVSSSEDFAQLLQQRRSDPSQEKGQDPEAALSPDELSAWLELFDSDEE